MLGTGQYRHCPQDDQGRGKVCRRGSVGQIASQGAPVADLGSAHCCRPLAKKGDMLQQPRMAGNFPMSHIGANLHLFPGFYGLKFR